MGLFNFPMGDAAVIVWLFVLGTVIGSFLNVCIHRFPQNEYLWPQLKALVSPPSSCPGCSREILRRDNIPVLGWLLLRGRCRFCSIRISPRYPVIEFLNGLLFVVLYLAEIPMGMGETVAGSSLFSEYWSQTLGVTTMLTSEQVVLLHVRYAYHLVLVEALVVATFIDFDHWIIPDGATVPAMCVGVLGAWAFGNLWLVPVWFHDNSIVDTARAVLPWLKPILFGGSSQVPGWIAEWEHLHGLANSLAGLVVGGGVVWAVRLVGAGIMRREAMGFGDVILMAMIGSFLGWQPVVVVFFLAPFCALVAIAFRRFVQRQREIPYGPYLSLAAVLMLLGWQQIWPRVERIFEMGALLIPLAIMGIIALAASLYLLQLVKRMLGITTDEELVEEGWGPADQLSFFAGEKVDVDVGGWKESAQPDNSWPGSAAGRGQSFNQRWRR
ncbi:MAG: prepilin peptidase [Planctomycetaceae bacterium]|nr:prepilin peptidase [Planctomycetaceae bacterium]MBT6487002.1 prepilin peptidase [Planctomycetaceae bacterium]MBT6493108.1 prepilin peptidase [Planctomycetaceae bacterium]